MSEVRAERGTLTPPVGERDHVAGPATAPVTLVEYGDFECPSCRKAWPMVKELQRRLGKNLRFVFRNFPLTKLHPNAARAAEAAEAAAAQGAFWQMHDRLFERQFALEDDNLIEYATELGLDADRIRDALQAGTYRARVKEDAFSGLKSGVNGTPTFFINGERYDGPHGTEPLFEALQGALRS
ncbi:MAG TPA: thioredoxin domain-containing protein [Gemmatimonadales bacterium]|jgi:protein-disulfide isomerase|nr:thioredoxin domain-containing protein [Gemmatimonadales bacterium]